MTMRDMDKQSVETKCAMIAVIGAPPDREGGQSKLRLGQE